MRRHAAWIAMPLVVAAVALSAQTAPAAGPDAEAQALLRDGQTAWHKRQFEDALIKFTKLQDAYGTTAVAPDAALAAGLALMGLGDPIGALEQMQQVRARGPKAAAATALARASILRRLYARPSGTPPYGVPDRVGAEKLENITALAATARGAVYRATEKTVDVAVAAEGDQPPAGPFGKPQLTVANDGKLVVIEPGRLLLSPPGKAVALAFAKPGKAAEPLDKIEDAVQLSNGDWLVMDADLKQILRFPRDGKAATPFETQPAKDGYVRATRLAVNAFDDVAALVPNDARVVIFDATGANRGQVSLRKRVNEVAPGQDPYDFKAALGVAFDDFGHLYVMDQKMLGIFSPWNVGAKPSAPKPAGAGAGREDLGAAYQLKFIFTEPASRGREGFKAGAFAIDRAGALYLYDESLKQILVYR